MKGSSDVSVAGVLFAFAVFLATGCESILDIHEGKYVATGGSAACTGAECDAGNGEGGAFDGSTSVTSTGGAPNGDGGARTSGGGTSGGGAHVATGGNDAGGSGNAGGRSGSAGANAGGQTNTGGCAGTACSEPPSCVGLPKNCGDQQNDDCCASPLVSQGTFSRSPDAQIANATVAAFRLDKYEITVGRFRKFVTTPSSNLLKNGVGKHTYLHGGSGLLNAAIPQPSFEQGWQHAAWDTTTDPVRDRLNLQNLLSKLVCDASATWTDDKGDNETKPINCISWFVAYAFCIWDGGFLPSDAEAKYAAAGGEEQRVYPWTAPGETPVLDETHAVYCPAANNCLGPLPVGSRPDGVGKYGQMDLVGNVAEWTLDAGDSTYPPACENCSYLPDDSSPSAEALVKNRSMLGGSFKSDTANMSWSRRQQQTPQNTFEQVGARCARRPPS